MDTVGPTRAPSWLSSMRRGGYDRAMPKSRPGRALVGVRLVFGTSSWFAPKFVMVALGMDPHSNPQGAYMARLFGVRDLALGIGLVSTRGDARRLWWRLGMLCDVGDMASGVLSARQGELPPGPRTLPLFVGAGAIGASLGAAALIARDV